MAEQASNFMRDWIASNIKNDPAWWDRSLEERVTAEVGRLKKDARDAGIELDDPELDDGLLHDEINAAVEHIHNSEAGGIKISHAD